MLGPVGPLELLSIRVGIGMIAARSAAIIPIHLREEDAAPTKAFGGETIRLSCEEAAL